MGARGRALALQSSRHQMAGTDRAHTWQSQMAGSVPSVDVYMQDSGLGHAQDDTWSAQNSQEPRRPTGDAHTHENGLEHAQDWSASKIGWGHAQDWSASKIIHTWSTSSTHWAPSGLVAGGKLS